MSGGQTQPVDAWRVETARVTAFPGDVVNVDGLSWWLDVIGSAPESVLTRSRAGQYNAQGEVDGRRMTLQVQPGRIEWNLTPVVKPDDEPLNFPTLGLLDDVSQSLAGAVRRWLPMAPILKRVAFGAALVQPVDGLQVGYARLQPYLGRMRPDLDGASDFFYQINRPRTSRSGVEGLAINRLTRWTVQVAQRMTLTIAPGGADTRSLGEETACRLELDINTAADFGELPPTSLEVLLGELIALGREIAERGDIR
jgi:hypothetical protein